MRLRQRGFLLAVGVSLGLLACGREHKAEADASVPGKAPQPEASSPCPASTASDCAAAWDKIKDLEGQRDQAVQAGKKQAAAQAILDINYQTQLLELLMQGPADPKKQAELDSKYAQLRNVIEQQGQVAYDPREVQAVAAVFKDYGELYIAETAATGAGAPAEELTVSRPWAGYWYPFRGDDLFQDAYSPLSKLDHVLSLQQQPAATAEQERQQFNPNADSWEGRCAPWAVAAITSPEPKHKVRRGDTEFTIADQKALLTLMHERYPVKVYGIRYDGDAETDGTFQSMRPEAFHQLFRKLLGEEHRAFILNDDSGSEVWSRPVYRVRWTVQPDPSMPHAVIVNASAFSIFNRNAITEDLTSDILDRHDLDYSYRLYLDPNQSRDGKYKVIAGEWLDASRAKHPHYITVPAVSGPLLSNNTELNKVADVVATLLKSGNDRP